MNEIINNLCVVLLCASLFTSLNSLIRTISAYKRHEKEKKKLEDNYHKHE